MNPFPKGPFGNNLFNLRQPLPDGRGSDALSEPRPLGSDWPSCFFTIPNVRMGAILGLLLVSAGCMVGPNYKRPAAVTPPAFKEQAPVNFKEAEAAGWKPSQPGDDFAKGRWWELYNDAALNALEEQVSVSNQNVLRAEAQYQQARAAVDRKSTRLNSSHLGISYAVFCLK